MQITWCGLATGAPIRFWLVSTRSSCRPSKASRRSRRYDRPRSCQNRSSKSPISSPRSSARVPRTRMPGRSSPAGPKRSNRMLAPKVEVSRILNIGRCAEHPTACCSAHDEPRRWSRHARDRTSRRRCHEARMHDAAESGPVDVVSVFVREEERQFARWFVAASPRLPALRHLDDRSSDHASVVKCLVGASSLFEGEPIRNQLVHVN
jgi:hypothetical protein